MGKPMTTPTDRREQHAYGDDVLLPGPKLEFTAATPSDTRAEGEALRWLQRVLDGTSVKISSGNWRVEKDHWHGITMSVSLARALSAQLAEAQQKNGAAWDIIVEAINSWDEWMLDDDYDAMGALNRIMSRMKKRASFYKFGDGEHEDRGNEMATCAKCGSQKLSERPCPKCGVVTNKKDSSR